ncbi:hypothetical protein GCM10011534_35480 [Pseudooceanicola nanhaiensis]|uniref:Uncharacterized protein n=1 Tax=Pseudooceanicola nanhaiensis TaxID=375761 RepID=A0A917T5Z0_9RHOB|nr:hypothetical protein GCM10011534_35480 [Pseudooceanicola nanhaiensis]
MTSQGGIDPALPMPADPHLPERQPIPEGGFTPPVPPGPGPDSSHPAPYRFAPEAEGGERAP